MTAMQLSPQAQATLAPTETERALLSCCLLEPEILKWIDLRADHFADLKCRTVWDAMGKLRANDISADVMVLEHEIAAAGKLDAIGGLAYLGELATIAATSANVEHYADILRSARTTRRAMSMASSIQEWVERGIAGDDLTDRIASAVGAMETKVCGGALTTRDLIKTEWKAITDHLEAIERGEPANPGIPTGIVALDKLIGGIPRRLPSLMASRPGIGKSTVAMNIAKHAASVGYGVHWLTTEDPLSMPAQRLMANATGIDSRVIANRSFARRGQIADLTAGIPALLKRPGPLWENAKGQDARWICRRIQASASQNKTDLVVVDMLHRIRGPSGIQKLTERIGENITTLDACTSNLGMALLMVVHMTREHEREYKGECPELRGLSDSDNLGRDCKLIMVLERPQDSATKVDLWVSKNNNGPDRVKVQIGIDKAHCRVHG